MAISSYMKALDIEKNNRVLLNLGVEYYNRRDYVTALKYFKESLSRDGEFLEGNFYTGMAYFNLKDLKIRGSLFSEGAQDGKKT